MAWDSAYLLVNWFLLLPQCSVLIETIFFAWIAVITVTEVEEAAAMCFHYGSPVCCHPLRRQRGGGFCVIPYSTDKKSRAVIVGTEPSCTPAEARANT